MKFQPLHLGLRRPEPFSHQHWLFEIKYDGFRALAQIEHGRSKLVSRNGNEFKSLPHAVANTDAKIKHTLYKQQCRASTMVTTLWYMVKIQSRT